MADPDGARPVDGKKHGNTFERNERNNLIVAARARGVPVRQIAESFSVSEDTVIRVMREWRDGQPKLREQDPLEVIDDVLLGYQADLEELAILSMTAKSESNRIGAINSRMAARDRIVALLQSTGVLPRDLGKLSVEIDVRFISQRVVQVLQRHEVPVTIQRELLAALRGELEAGG